jgi:flavoprotein
MPYTGLFLLRHASADSDRESGLVSRVTAVKATCLSCERLVDATDSPDLEIVTGGAILYCRGCGTRQVISNAHFDEFLARTRRD